MRFFRDIPTPTRIRWYWTDPSRGMIPFVHRFGSDLTRGDYEGYSVLGEVYGATRKWANGKPNGVVPLRGFCGTREQWINGSALPPDPPIVLGDDGFPLCCGIKGAAFDTGFDFGFDS